MVSRRSKQERTHSPQVVDVLGYYGKENLGDEIFIPAIRSLFPSCLVNFAYPNRDELTGQTLILGGGDVIKKLYLKDIDRPYHILGVGLGYESELELLGNNVVEAYFRNRVDAAAARQKGFNAHYCPDLAFALDIDRDERGPRDPEEKKRLAVILANSVINPGMGLGEMPDLHYLEYMKWELARALDSLSQWYDISFLFMSHACYAYDQAAAMDTASRMKTGHESEILPFTEIEELQDFDLVVTMKFHGMIFSTMMGIPFVNIGTTRKMETFCRENCLSELSIPTYSFTANRLFDAVKRAEADGVSDKLLALARNNREHWEQIKPKLAAWLK